MREGTHPLDLHERFFAAARDLEAMGETSIAAALRRAYNDRDQRQPWALDRWMSLTRAAETLSEHFAVEYGYEEVA